MTLDYCFVARLTDTVEIGSVSGGVRLDNYFDGRMTEGSLARAAFRVQRVDATRDRSWLCPARSAHAIRSSVR